MSVNEAIVEDAALEWFGELGYAVGHGPQLAPGEQAVERDSFSEVVMVGHLRKVLRVPRNWPRALSANGSDYIWCTAMDRPEGSR